MGIRHLDQLLGPRSVSVIGASDREASVARAVADSDNMEAELGVIVRSDLKGQGLGSLLLRKLIDHFTQQGTQRPVALSIGAM